MRLSTKLTHAMSLCRRHFFRLGQQLPYGIGFGAGNGWTPQIPDAQGGSGGVGMRNSLPWVDALPPVMH
jgi:hypothetical protein